VRVAFPLLDIALLSGEQLGAGGTTMLGLHGDCECPLRRAMHHWSSAAICAFLGTVFPHTPRALTIDWAGVGVALLMLQVTIGMVTFTSTGVSCHINTKFACLRTTTARSRAAFPLREFTNAIYRAICITTQLRSLGAIQKWTFLATELGHHVHVVSLGPRASSAEVLASTATSNSCVASVVFAPMAFACDWAIWHVAHRLEGWRFRHSLDAFFTSMLGF